MSTEKNADERLMAAFGYDFGWAPALEGVVAELYTLQDAIQFTGENDYTPRALLNICKRLDEITKRVRSEETERKKAKRAQPLREVSGQE